MQRWKVCPTIQQRNAPYIIGLITYRAGRRGLTEPFFRNHDKSLGARRGHLNIYMKPIGHQKGPFENLQTLILDNFQAPVPPPRHTFLTVPPGKLYWLGCISKFSIKLSRHGANSASCPSKVVTPFSTIYS